MRRAIREREAPHPRGAVAAAPVRYQVEGEGVAQKVENAAIRADPPGARGRQRLRDDGAVHLRCSGAGDIGAVDREM